MRQQVGFTLIELMVVILIIGALSALAVPAYTDNIRKANRADAQGLMGTLLLDEEKYFATNLSYTTTLGSAGLQYSTQTKGVPIPLVPGVFPDSDSYRLTLVNCQDVSGAPIALNSCVRVLAIAQKKQHDKDCLYMILQSDGRKDSLGGNPNLARIANPAFPAGTSMSNSTRETCWKG